MNAPFVREFAGKADLVDFLGVGRGIEPFDRFEAYAFERLLSLGGLVQNFLERLLFPPLLFGLCDGLCFFDLGCHVLITWS